MRYIRQGVFNNTRYDESLLCHWAFQVLSGVKFIQSSLGYKGLKTLSLNLIFSGHATNYTERKRGLDLIMLEETR